MPSLTATRRIGHNDPMHEETEGRASEPMPNEGDKAAEKRPWVTPDATIKSVAQVTKTGVAGGKDATCHS
jgi:hypothetical protein